MTPEQIRIAIANSLGFEVIVAFGIHFGIRKGKIPCILPNYTTNNKASLSLEYRLTVLEMKEYYKALEGDAFYTDAHMHLAVINATAAQRCEAYLKTKGLWKDYAK